MKLTKVLLAVLLVCMMVVPAFAVEAKPEETVDVTITFTSTDAYSFGVAFEYPSELELVGVPSASVGFVGPAKWGAIGSTLIKDATCTFTFKIPSTAKVGDTYEITASVDRQSDLYGNPVSSGQVTGATIVIVGTEPAPHDHTWDAGKVTKEATCTEAGEMTYTCTVCGDTRTEDIPATGKHTYDAGKVTKEATCVDKGSTTYICTVCGETKTEDIPATSEHKWDNGKVTKAATCVEAGVKTYTCTVCGETKTEVIPATGHTWKEQITEPTCGKAGESKMVCSVCGEVDKTSIVVLPATGDHKWDEGKITTNPTGTKPGVKTYTCTVCGTTKNEEIAPTGEHNYVGKVTKEPTCGEDGIKTYTCTDCGASYTEKIPATGNHTPVVKNKVSPTATLPGYTGDTYCSVCGKLIKIGQRIAPIGGSQSSWNPGRIIPTVKDKNDTDTSKTETVPAKSEEKDDFPFTDVYKTDSFYDDVKYVYDNGIMNGVSATEFAPYSTLTRAMIVTILYRVEGEPLVPYTGAFADVEDDQWYTYGVEWAAINGIVNGYGEGKYGPNDAVTLEQLAAILNRYAEYKGYKVENGAAVTGNVSAWAMANVNWAFGNTILGEAADYTVPAYRYEVAIAIHAFCENVAK